MQGKNPGNLGISIQQPVVAGSWYPAQSAKLKSIIISLLDSQQLTINQPIKALILPHAGYQYSGKIAASGYKQLSHPKLNKSYKTVIILALSHHAQFNGISVLSKAYYQTPLGKIKLSKKTAQLLKEKIAKYLPEAYEKEHSLEIHLPFLQSVLKDFELLPIITGNVNPEELAAVLEKYTDSKTLVLASSDLSHFHDYGGAVSLDACSISSILSLDPVQAMNNEMCGIIPVLTLIYLAKKLNLQPRFLTYLNSGDITHEKASVVGYTSIAFTALTKEQKLMLSLARANITSRLDNKAHQVNNIPASLKQIKACFVTLTIDNQLRGCIGSLTASKPLCQNILDNSLNAAFHDPRFSPLAKEELSSVKIEISILTPPRKLSFSQQEDLLSKLKPFIHGVILKLHNHKSTFLPQVWEQLPDKQEFLEHLSMKAGLPEDAWKDPAIEISVYEVEKFSE